MNTLQIRIFGGLPVIVEYELSSSRDDDTIVEDMQLTDRRGRRADWAEKKMTSRDWESVEDQIFDSLPMYMGDD